MSASVDLVIGAESSVSGRPGSRLRVVDLEQRTDVEADAVSAPAALAGRLGQHADALVVADRRGVQSKAFRERADRGVSSFMRALDFNSG